MADKASLFILDRRYQLQKLLGKGGMGAVYLAKDLLTGKPVALKQVTVPVQDLMFDSRGDNSDFHLALAQEFQVLATIRHPNIIDVYEFGFDQESRPYFTMEYVEDGRPILDGKHQYTQEKKIDLIIQMLLALTYLHRRGVIHRDLKPGNVLVIDGQVKFLDFGISVITSRTMEHQTQTTAGTMAYLAPELFQDAPYSRESDLYAVGIIAFELLTGQYPYRQSNMATMLADILNKQIDVEDYGIAGELAQVLSKLLAKERDRRYWDASQVIHDLCDAAEVPLPPETAEIRDSFLQAAKFIGRDDEIAQLTQLLEGTLRGVGAVVMIKGVSGVGKSRLIEELRTLALVKGVLVLWGHAIGEGQNPYQLWRDIGRGLILDADINDEEAAVFRSIVPEIDSMIDRNLPDIGSLVPVEAQERLHGILKRLLTIQERPVMILLEDLQWAGSESIKLLSDLALNIANRSLLIVGTYRDDRPLKFLEDMPVTQTIKLNRFIQQDIADLSASMIGEAGHNPQLINLLAQETEGNAFFLVEVVRALAEGVGYLEEIGRGSLPKEITTGGIQAILERRLNRLPKVARPLLQLAAISGRQLDLNLLSMLEPGIALDRWVTSCANVAVVEAQGNEWRFSHEKLREEILFLIDDEERPRFHQRVAIALEKCYPENDEKAAALAYHWAMTGDVNKEYHYSIIAAHHASRLSANTEAIALFRRSLELLSLMPDTTERATEELGIQMGLGPLLIATYGYWKPDVKNTFSRAEELALQTGQSESLYVAVWGQWVYYGFCDQETAREMVKHLFQLAERSKNDSLLLEAHHSGWRTEWIGGEVVSAENHVQKGLKIYDLERHHDHIHIYGHDPGVCAYFAGSHCIWLLGYPDKALERVQKGLVLAEKVDHLFTLAIIKNGDLGIRRLRGEIDMLRSKSEEQIEFAQKHGFPTFSMLAKLYKGAALLNEGVTIEGIKHIREADKYASGSGQYSGFRMFALMEHLEACLLSGLMDEGIQTVLDELKVHPLTGQRTYESEIRRLFGELILAKDGNKMTAAEREFRLALDIARQQQARSLELRAVMSLSRLWQKQGKREEAHRSLAEIYDWFTEGFETSDLIKAKRLLDELD